MFINVCTIPDFWFFRTFASILQNLTQFWIFVEFQEDSRFLQMFVKFSQNFFRIGISQKSQCQVLGWLTGKPGGFHHQWRFCGEQCSPRVWWVKMWGPNGIPEWPAKLTGESWKKKLKCNGKIESAKKNLSVKLQLTLGTFTPRWVGGLVQQGPKKLKRALFPEIEK